MAANDPYDSTLGEEEHILPLSNNRQLAYAHNGPATSRTVIIFFPGLFGVGSAPRVFESCRELQAHFIAPTLPGMGKTSTRDKSVPYHVSLAKDISALLSHLYPTDAFDTCTCQADLTALFPHRCYMEHRMSYSPLDARLQVVS